ncbi:molybdenum cofactor biosynthesis protein B [Thalassobacillus sp. CUG 92003]|uniref:MogA/MoaB family molybdenum cofactor biosynthesis protein n=1 Tax=Thalassobacillus sp. CUG 92003 TaxID=2736641 RepID=UPI0015E65481|nr:MogA/MoaB family molybdenum cofactor biosynthesis protein [Thalassobacillus sp. CUG 92003]
MSVHEHKQQAPEHVRCHIITVSDTRTLKTDKSGHLMHEKLTDSGYTVVDHQVVKDEKETIREAVQVASRQTEVDVILTNGGTGVAERDVTIEVVQSLLDKELPGFGEIFRMLSYTEDIGSSAILSRALAGITRNTVIFSTPGSSGAVKLAMDKLILPEMAHVVRETQKDLPENEKEA